jgi:deazaflavin-dependent oxidoreductase (nitroreductase family)
MTSREERNANNAGVIEQFRSNGGTIPDRPEQVILLLNTTGAKTGLPRTNPVVYLPGEDCVYVFATKGGSPVHPDWYFNLVAHPVVTVEIGAETYQATAEPITGPERDRLYAKLVAKRPNFGTYQDNTTRVIPVVGLRRNPT